MVRGGTVRCGAACLAFSAACLACWSSTAAATLASSLALKAALAAALACSFSKAFLAPARLGAGRLSLSLQKRPLEGRAG